MCSTFKASLAACVLASVDKGLTRLDELIAYGPDDLLEYAPVAKQNLEKGSAVVGLRLLSLDERVRQAAKGLGIAVEPA